MSYDAAIKRWLPVRSQQVRKDGLAYAYAEPFRADPSDASYTATRIHVVSLPDGADRVIESGPPREVLAYQAEGIYVTAPRFGSEGATGLWRLDPESGAATQLPNGTPFRTVDRGIAWTDHLTITPTRLDRIDVATGAAKNWVDTQSEGWIWFVGLDAGGHPLVNVVRNDDKSERLYVYTAPQTRTLLAQAGFHQPGTIDAHGTWLAGEDGVYLVTKGPKLEKVSNATGGNVAGPCA